MKQIIRIVAGLTLSCVIAGLLMGAVYVVTAKAKQRNAELATQETMLRLLGYSRAHPAPATLAFRSVWRYVVTTATGEKYSAYVVPVGAADGEEGFRLLSLALDGSPRGEPATLPLARGSSADARAREAAVRAIAGATARVEFGDEMVVAREDGRRAAYLLPGEFQGFKTRIRVILALDPDFRILGLEIMEHEEDPGLGAEITRGYFKNQFRGKTMEKLRTLGVVKAPLPDDYRRALEARGNFTTKELAAIESRYQESDIYAITGATISSRSVTDGVRGMVARFASRLAVLDRAVASAHLVAAY